MDLLLFPSPWITKGGMGQVRGVVGRRDMGEAAILNGSHALPGPLPYDRMFSNK